SNGRPANGRTIEFDMVHSGAVATCLPNASGHVRITSNDIVQTMHMAVHGLAPNTIYTIFIIQAPLAPFGMAWYAGDVETDINGDGEQRLVGIFSDETFIHALGSIPAPVEHSVDASSNPATAPVHMYHVGVWFDDHNDASAHA